MATLKQTPQEILKGQTILISGGAGFVAGALIERLLVPEFAIKKIYTIVRSKPARPAAARLPAGLQPHIGQRLMVLDGDVALPNFGLSSQDWTSLDEVDIVIHAAANTNFEPPLSHMLRTVTDLGYFMACFSLAKPQVKVHMHISTCFVAWNLPHGSIAKEEALNPIEYPHYTPYFQSKAMAEGVVTALVDQAETGALFRIARLPIVGPAASFPYPGSGSTSSSPVCALLSAHPRPADLSVKTVFDVIPVDICVDQIIALTASALLSARSSKPTRAVQIYNLAAGSDGSRLVQLPLMLDAPYKIAKPRIPWAIVWKAYEGVFMKSVLFDTSKRDAVLGLSIDSTATARDPTVDCSRLNISIPPARGWTDYYHMIRKHMNDLQREKEARRSSKL